MVSGNFVEAEIEKYPLSFVYVPEVVPLIITDTAGMASFVVELRTVPLMVTVCAKACKENNAVIRQAAVKRRLLLILGNFGFTNCDGKIRIVICK